MRRDIREKERVVYALLDPRDNTVKYIGTAVSIKERFQAHQRENYDIHTPKGQWIAELQRIGAAPTLQILEKGVSFITAFDREQHWINEYLKQGAQLTNIIIKENVAHSGTATLRKQLEFTQEALAAKAGITLQTYRNAEAGKNCTYITATAILKALNGIRQEQSQESVTIEKLGLRIV